MVDEFVVLITATSASGIDSNLLCNSQNDFVSSPDPNLVQIYANRINSRWRHEGDPTAKIITAAEYLRNTSGGFAVL